MGDEIDGLLDKDKRPKAPKPVLNTQIKASPKTVAKVTDDKMMAGQYMRQQVLLPPGQLRYIKDKAKELGMSQQSFYRWLIDLALVALDEGERPKMTTRMVVGEAVKKHWTSEVEQ